jgi:hypothetical protein
LLTCTGYSILNWVWENLQTVFSTGKICDARRSMVEVVSTIARFSSSSAFRALDEIGNRVGS